MKLTKNPPRVHGPQWLRDISASALLASLMTMFMPLTAFAEEDIGNFINPSCAFTWYSKGQGCMHLTLQLTSKLEDGSYRDLKECIFYLKGSDGKTEQATKSLSSSRFPS